MDMVGTHVPFENFDVPTATDFPDEIPHAVADLPHQHRAVRAVVGSSAPPGLEWR